MNYFFNIIFGKAELLPNKPKLNELFAGLIGGTASILFLEWLTSHSGNLLIAAPFGASCVILYALPKSPLAQPRNVIFGHVLSVSVGIFFLKYIGDSQICVALSVGVAISLMQFFRCLHPPAGANSLVVFLSGSSLHPSWDFVLFPFASGAIAIVLVALVVNNLFLSERWPVYVFALKSNKKID